MTTPIYRVIVRTTGSSQPIDTTWMTETIYCGQHRDKARIAFHNSSPDDRDGNFGNPARETIMQRIDDADTEDPADDKISTMSCSGESC